LEAETGKQLWQFEYPTDYRDMLGYNNGPRCSPVVDGNRVYIFGAEGMLHCVRVADGQPIWKLNTAEKYNVVQNFFGVGSTPVVAGDLLICMVGGSPPDSPGLYESGGRVTGNGSGIVALNKYTGEEKYKITDELASYAGMQLATISGRPWCFAFARGGLVGFEPVTGKVDFHYPWRSRLLESVNASTPVVAGNEVFISETYEIGSSLLAVRPGGYDIVWRDSSRRREKSLKTHWNTAIHLDGYLYACHGRNEPDADLRCIEWKTGKVRWVEKAAPEAQERSSLLYMDGHFICLGETGSLKLIKANPRKYELVSEISVRRNPEPLAPLGDPYWAAPILSHGLLYLHGEDRLLCMELIAEKREG
jgi:outer membrane protein assembly factor BamB